jgi:type IX secretion system PorP/SprF family membrane protein
MTTPVIMQSQDISFSQFYAAPLYLNPSLSGNTECARLATTYRNQWPGIPDAFETLHLAYDQSFPEMNSGIGVSVLLDKKTESLSTSALKASYAYTFQASDEWIVRAGLEAGITQANLDFTALSDYIEPNNYSSKVNPDFAVGLSFDWDGRYYGGLAIHHLNEPDYSFYENGSASVPMKYTLSGGALYEYDPAIYSKKSIFFSPNFIYQQQGAFRQLNLGMYVKISPLIAGLWFRHNFENPDAAIALIGLETKKYKIGYSYDYSVSPLANYSGGSHEVSISYKFCIYVEKRRKVRAIKCPEF